MQEVELKFKRENRNGLVATGSYLFDAARRLGIEVEAECGRVGECDSCAMKIKDGNECLSEPTFAEVNQLTDKRRTNGERLSCQAKIEKAGEIVVMTNKKKETEKSNTEEKTEEYRKQFEEMPLEKKIASLLELEAIALGETFSFVLNSPFKIFDIAMGVMAEFGLKLEDDAKKATRPKEHKQEEGNSSETNGAQTDEKIKEKTKRKTTQKKDEHSK
ncbi:MAG: 2Fe-2S iron-sulfur cluster-binding protein [Pyrinomonadaceae bacterium]